MTVSLRIGMSPAERVPVEASAYPPGVILHVPHASKRIARNVRAQFVLGSSELRSELLRMTDHWTHDIFREPRSMISTVVARFSRLVVDVERFEQDEPNERYGMGAIYRNTSQGQPLRRKLSEVEVKHLLNTYYRPHHRRLTRAVDACLQKFGSALIIDAHSFSSRPLPHEDQTPDRPDICIGFDSFHTSDRVRDAFVRRFKAAGFSVAVNHPFAGSIVPMKHYRMDRRVQSVLVELNRGLYMDEASGERKRGFESFAAHIRDACRRAAGAAIYSR